MTIKDFIAKTKRQADRYGWPSALRATISETGEKTIKRPGLHVIEQALRRRYPAQESRLRKLQSHEEYLLLVFDAGRADVLGPLLADAFETTSEPTFSVARDTFEWISTQWRSSVNDVTYISGMVPVSTQTAELDSEWFSELYAGTDFITAINEIVPVWDDDWDASVGTTPPDAVTRAAIDCIDREQLVVHYAQPHAPYIGMPELLGYTNTRSANPLQGDPVDEPIWERVRAGQVSDLELWLAYVGNAVRAIEAAKPLVEAWDGPIYATADHGEALGRFDVYGHARRPHPAKRIVPWAEINGLRNRDRCTTSSDNVMDKLRSLGYR